jgi:hypothetical protein
MRRAFCEQRLREIHFRIREMLEGAASEGSKRWLAIPPDEPLSFC